MFDHMNMNNKSQAELDQMRRKKRKINEISQGDASITLKEGSKQSEGEFKEPKAKKSIQEIKECPFNPFGDDSCDMCGA